MKVLYDYTPDATGSDPNVTITQVDAGGSPVSPLTGYPLGNLKLIEPIKSWKSADITHDVYLVYDFGGTKTINTVFLNRFNFASFSLLKKANIGDAWTAVKKIDGITDAVYSSLTKDEIYDENYMHYWCEVVFSTRYLCLKIPIQTPLFEQSYFKLGNMLVGNYVEVWNPKPGYQVEIADKIEDTVFDSGYRKSYKLGRSIHLFQGQFDKLNLTEYAKFRQSILNPFVLHHDWEGAGGDGSKAYLVKQTKGRTRSYDQATIMSGAYSYEELA